MKVLFCFYFVISTKTVTEKQFVFLFMQEIISNLAEILKIPLTTI